MTVVNLRLAKKRAARNATRADADANAAKFGQTRAERQLEAVKTEKARRALDGHRRETD